jgi:cytochrome bd-I ubiquinol oxidase subunit X
MWYFSWILGVGVALSFGIINVMWLESHRFGDSGAPRQSPVPRPLSGAARESRSTDSRRP